MGAPYDIGSVTTTDFSNLVPDFIVEAKALDVASADIDLTYIYFPEAPQNFGYYFNHPQVSSPANALASWTVSRGWKTTDPVMKAQLDHVSGMGKDTFETLMWNHEVVKLIVGDAFMEVIMNEKKTIILNMIPISPERVRIAIKGARIAHYEIYDGTDWIEKDTDEILHSQNKRIGDQNH